MSDSPHLASDREPLLREDRTSFGSNNLRKDAFPPPRTAYDKVADVVAALKAGKLPTQEQANRVLRYVLSSDILTGGAVWDNGTRTEEEEEPREVWSALLKDTRNAGQAFLEFGTEKNGT